MNSGPNLTNSSIEHLQHYLLDLKCLRWRFAPGSAADVIVVEVAVAGKAAADTAAEQESAAFVSAAVDLLDEKQGLAEPEPDFDSDSGSAQRHG